MVTTGIRASTGHSLAPDDSFYLYASMFYFLAYTYFRHYFFETRSHYSQAELESPM